MYFNRGKNPRLFDYIEFVFYNEEFFNFGLYKIEYILL